MTKNIKPRDAEAISAYLDNQLTPRERARLESRMQNDPALRAALGELRQTRTLLRSLPQVRPPRNFTLSPEMVGQRPSRLRLFPTLQFASALATILLVLFVAGDVLGVLAPAPGFTTAQRAAPPEAAVQDTAEALEAQALPAEEPTPAEALPAEEPAAEALPAEAPAAEIPPLETLKADPTYAGEAEDAAALEGRVGVVGAEQTPEGRSVEPEENGEEELPASAASSTAEQLQEGLADPSLQETEPPAAPAPAEAEPQSEQQPVATEEPPEEAPPLAPLLTSTDQSPAGGFGIPALRLIEAGLGAIAVITGTLAILLRRRAGV